MEFSRLNIYPVFILFIFMVLGCEERDWRNPFDPDVRSSDWAPTQLTVSTNADSVFLDWENGAIVDVQYKIQRRCNDGVDEFSVIDSVSSTDYVDIPPGNSDGYSYQIRAYIGEKMSDPGKSVTVHYIPAGTELWSVQLTNGVNAAALSPDGQYLVIIEEHTVVSAGSYTINIHMIDVQSGEMVWTVADEDFSAAAIDVNTDDTMMGLAHFSGAVKVRDLATGSLVWEALHSDGKQCRQVVFSSDNTMLFTGGADSTVKAWDAANGDLLWQKRHGQSISVITMSQDNSRLIVGDYANRITAYSPVNGADLWSVSAANGIKALAISPDDQIIAAGIMNGDLLVLNSTDGSTIWSESFSGGMTFNLDFSNDGVYLLSAANYQVKLWQAVTGQLEWDTTFGSFIHNVSFSEDTRLVLVAGQLAALAVLNADSGTTAHEIPCDDWLFFCGFLPDGQTCYLIDGNTIRCHWVINTWEVNN